MINRADNRSVGQPSWQRLRRVGSQPQTVWCPSHLEYRRPAGCRYYQIVAMIAGDHDSACQADLSPAVALFRSLGDPTRLAIVHELACGERRVVDLTRTLKLAQSTVSAHVACLRDCGLVDGRPVGRQMLYRLTRPELLTVSRQHPASPGAARTARNRRIVLRPRRLDHCGRPARITWQR